MMFVFLIMLVQLEYLKHLMDLVEFTAFHFLKILVQVESWNRRFRLGKIKLVYF